MSLVHCNELIPIWTQKTKTTLQCCQHTTTNGRWSLRKRRHDAAVVVGSDGCVLTQQVAGDKHRSQGDGTDQGFSGNVPQRHGCHGLGCRAAPRRSHAAARAFPPFTDIFFFFFYRNDARRHAALPATSFQGFHAQKSRTRGFFWFLVRVDIKAKPLSRGSGV